MPDLVGIDDLVPMRALGALQQKVDRGRGAARLIGCPERLMVVTTLRMRLQSQPGVDLVGRRHHAGGGTVALIEECLDAVASHLASLGCPLRQSWCAKR